MDQSLLKLISGPRARLASERFLDLVDTLAERYGRAYGWKARVAKDLGVSPSYMTKLASRSVNFVDPKLIVRAIEVLNVTPEWFTAAERPSTPFGSAEDRMPSAAAAVYANWALDLALHLNAVSERLKSESLDELDREGVALATTALASPLNQAANALLAGKDKLERLEKLRTLITLAGTQHLIVRKFAQGIVEEVGVDSE